MSSGVTAPGTPLTGFVAEVGFEAALLGELGLAKADGPRWPGLVTTRRAVELDPAFALQVLPGARQVAGDSVAALVAATDQALAPAFDAGDQPIALHVYVPDRTAYRTLIGPSDLLGKAFRDHLRAGRLARRVLPAGRLGPGPRCCWFSSCWSGARRS